MRVRFLRQGDRFGHEISLVAGGQERVLLQTVEGDAAQAWPASPPFQQAALHAIDDARQAALLIGMAGKSHWSASVEADPAAGRILFDIACRLTEAPLWLGSAYETSAEAEYEAQAVTLADPSWPAGRLRLTPLSGAVFEEESRRRIILAAEPVSPPATVRWRYAAQWFPWTMPL